MSNNIFYVYTHSRLTNGEVFYVGKGSSRRAWERKGRNKHWHRVVEKHGYVVKIMKDHLSEIDAFRIEKGLISLIGRDNLCNKTDGGDGPSGQVMSEQSKKRMSISKTGKKLGPMPEEQKMKISQAQIGIPKPKMSESARLKISNALRLRVRKKETGEKISMSLIGKRSTEEQKENLSRKHGGRPILCIETGDKFYGASPASRWLQSIGHLRASPGAISNTCNGRSSHAYGFHFQYDL